MTSQLNPAWQRKTVSSDHLAKISDRFLSDGPRSEQTSDGCQVIPFLLDNADQGWIPEQLGEVLSERGRHSIVYNPEDHTADSNAPFEAVLMQKAVDREFCLLPTCSVGTIQSRRFDHVVLTVPASLEGILTAYRRIKLLSSGDCPEIGIIVVGPRDQHAAWRYFRKLAVGTLRYLDVALLNLGFLPHQVTPDNGPADHHRRNYLTRISERLLRSEFYSRHPAGPAEEQGQAR